jgi:hypothetical protein
VSCGRHSDSGTLDLAANDMLLRKGSNSAIAALVKSEARVGCRRHLLPNPFESPTIDILASKRF